MNGVTMFLSSIEDRWLLFGLTLIILLSYTATRDPLLGDSVKYLIGATGGILLARAQKNLIVTGGDKTDAIVQEFVRTR